MTAKHYAREFFDLPGLIRNLFRHRELIRTMTWRDFTARYRGSVGGLLWSVVQPLTMMVIYTIIFSLFLKVRFSTDASPVTFSVYLLCGLLPWFAFSDGLSLSTNVIRSNVNLVKRVVFPLEILPLNLVLIATIQQTIGFILLLPLAWFVSGQLYWTILLLPLILLLQLLFAIGLNWIIASLAVYLPDFEQIISLAVTVWFFLTPIIYPLDVVPAEALIFFRLNPMANLINLYRKAILTGEIPNPGEFLGIFAFCFFVFLAGYFWFVHTKRGFADVL